MSLRARALEYLARREHSRAELERKLAAHLEEGEDLPALLDDFEKRGWVSEARVVEQVIHGRRGKFGAARIARELRDKGISPELIGDSMARLQESELDAARAVWRKKFGGLPGSASERAKQIRFLQGRGFGLEVILELLRHDD